jgi:transcriptional regulator with XRE-family HTH domain
MEETIRDIINIGHTIYSVRKRKNITQKQLAKMTRTRQATISNFENGTTDLHVETLLSLLRGLDLEMVIRPKNSKAIDVLEVFLSE